MRSFEDSFPAPFHSFLQSLSTLQGWILVLLSQGMARLGCWLDWPLPMSLSKNHSQRDLGKPSGAYRYIPYINTASLCQLLWWQLLFSLGRLPVPGPSWYSHPTCCSLSPDFGALEDLDQTSCLDTFPQHKNVTGAFAKECPDMPVYCFPCGQERLSAG